MTDLGWRRRFVITAPLCEGGRAFCRMVWHRNVDRSQPYCCIFINQYTDDPSKDYY